MQGGVPALNHHARQATEDHLHVAHLVDSAARPIRIRHSYAYALDRCRELPELHAQLPPDQSVVVVIEFDPDHTHVRRCL
jgi:hypothetical protein